MRSKIQQALFDLGITPNLTGFYYIIDMVEIIKSDEQREKSVCSIYEEIANKNTSTATRVERAIRHAISKADINSDAWKKYIGTKDTKNSVVVCALALHITED